MKLQYIETIGQGGFGQVDKVLGEDGYFYARKTFKLNQPASFPKELEDNVKKRFIREAKIQGAINHPNIVNVFGKNLLAEPPYFLMPLALSSLEKDINADRLLNGNFMNAIMDIIAGLEELHTMGIYHRDLKPANVLRFSGSEGGRDFYAISDFGLMSVNQTNISALTQTGMGMGSDRYTAPEIVNDLRAASAQSDIYSLGCILHTFVGKEERVPCNEIREDGEFAAILLTCTRKDPTRRFKSVTALRDALLSLGDINVHADSKEGEHILEILDNPEHILTQDDWNKIVHFVEDNSGSSDAVAVLRRLTIAHLNELLDNFSTLGSRLGLEYAKWIREDKFKFEECDGLSIRLSKFIKKANIETQAECLMAMFYMGTSHNRWYVERKFVELAGNSLDANLAKRLAVEIRADGAIACRAIDHLQYSINFDVNNLHPRLVSTFEEICK